MLGGRPPWHTEMCASKNRAFGIQLFGGKAIYVYMFSTFHTVYVQGCMNSSTSGAQLMYADSDFSHADDVRLEIANPPRVCFVVPIHHPPAASQVHDARRKKATGVRTHNLFRLC